MVKMLCNLKSEYSVFTLIWQISLCALYVLDKSMSKSNTGLPISTFLGNRVLIWLKYRKNYYNVICPCAGFILRHGVLGASEKETYPKREKR